MRPIRVTVCELHGGEPKLAEDWEQLVDHLERAGSDLLLLPELPFSPWLAVERDVDAERWDAAIREHEVWIDRLAGLNAPAVVGTRPVRVNGEARNHAFVVDGGQDNRRRRDVHVKSYLPDEPGFWEASWYRPGTGDFTVQTVSTDAGAVRVGLMVCTEMWFMQHARELGRGGADLVLSPRCTPATSLDKWLAGGRACATVAGAFSLSSNHADARFGGLGWVVDPEGNVLGTTSRECPWVTTEIDLEVARAAKHTYPRYVPDLPPRSLRHN